MVSSWMSSGGLSRSDPYQHREGRNALNNLHTKERVATALCGSLRFYEIVVDGSAVHRVKQIVCLVITETQSVLNSRFRNFLRKENTTIW